MATVAQTIKKAKADIEKLKTKAKPHLKHAQKVFDSVFPPPKR